MAKKTFNIDKDKNFSEWYTEIVKKTEIVDIRYPVKGFVVYTPYGFTMMKLMMRKLEDLYDNVGYSATLFPILVSDQALSKEADHAEGFQAEVFWIDKEQTKGEGRLALRPTSEAIMYPMFSLWTRSYHDLPIKVYQTTSVYRYETKATRPLIRGREVFWNEAHWASKNLKENMKIHAEAAKAYDTLFEELMSLKCLKLTRPDWDKFAGADMTQAWDLPMPDGKALQIGTNHNLGQGFAKAYDVKYTDENEKEQYAYLGSIGTAMRTLAGMLSVHGDNKGLILPYDIAPYQVIILPILFEGKEKIVNDAITKIEKDLKAKGIRVKVDDSDKRTGEKHFYWEMKGAPIRIEVGPRDVENKQAVIKNRLNDDKESVKLTDLVKYVQKLGAKFGPELLKRSTKILTENIKEAKDLKELVKIIKSGITYVKIPYCSMKMDGQNCEEKIKSEVHAEVRGTLYDKTEKVTGKCVVCKKDAKHIVYVSRTY